LQEVWPGMYPECKEFPAPIEREGMGGDPKPPAAKPDRAERRGAIMRSGTKT